MPYGSESKLSRHLACLLVFCCAGCGGVSGKSTEHGLFSERHRGVSWVATPQRFEQDTFLERGRFLNPGLRDTMSFLRFRKVSPKPRFGTRP